MNTLSQRIANLSPEKLALLEQRLMKQGTSSTKKQKITRRQSLEPCPLSFAQQRLWILNQLEPHNVYDISIAVRLNGTLNLVALQQTLNAIVTRHEALRTTFAYIDENPAQIVNDINTVDLQVVDLCDHDPLERETEVQQFLKSETKRPFNLSCDLMLRATLVRLAEEEHILLLVMHHVASDGWSLGVLFRELAIAYEAFSTGSPLQFAELPIQYADFAQWQRQWLSGDVLQTQLNYWKQQLEGAPTLLELPTDRPRPSIQTFQGSNHRINLNPQLTSQLKRLSQQTGTTLFMTLLTAFAVLLSRYSNQEDIVIGSPIANRNQSELESLIGFFVNTLALRVQLPENPTFLELLERVREITLGAYAHQDLPFEKLVEELQPQRSLSYSPLFQVMFVLQNTSTGTLELPGLSVCPVPVEDSNAKFDLTLTVEETQSGLHCEWNYDTNLFDPATIERMAGQFQILLEGVTANPTQRVGQLPLLSAAEQHQLLVEWNNTQVDYPLDRCLHRLFEAQVERTPDAIALIFEEKQLTYRELNARANQLAHYLQSLEAAPQGLIGICMERSLWMVIGLLAILKTGSAYVPLDPTYPKDRLAFMLSDSDTPLLLTQHHLLENLPEHNARAICVDHDWNIISTQSRENLDSGVTIDDLAYVIYTSGSTGKPKGAMNSHRGIVNRLLWMQDAYQLTASDRVLQKTPFSFDVSVWEFFWTLLTGACLVVAKPGGHQDSAYLARLIAVQNITTLHFVPPMLQVFLNEQNLEQCNCLRQVICSGEALPSELQRRFFSRLNAQLHNLYGPTEAAIDVTYWQCEPNSQLSTVPIGRPIANIQLYILDRYLQPVPIGVPGELHIGGIGVAKGYLNRLDLTEQKFIADPFSQDDSGRLYKTGDLARYLPDGNIEFLGRIDHQVKIRGFRVEIGEVEAVLNQHPQVREAVVIARLDSSGNNQLVAYMVSSLDPNTASHDLRSFLKDKLPDYFVPAVFVSLENLPLTPNGKVDRKALPSPDLRLSMQANYVPPRDKIELQLTQIWEEVLEVSPIGVRDNFFDFGGHSLSAITLMTRIEQQFDKNVSLAALFQHPTIDQLATLLRSSVGSHTSSIVVALQPNGSHRPFFCVHPGQGTVMAYVDLAQCLGSDYPFYGLESLGLYEEGKSYSRIEDMAMHYIEAMRSVQPQGPYNLGGWSFGGLVAYEMAQQLYAQGQQVSLLGLFDTYGVDFGDEAEQLPDDAAFLLDLLSLDQIIVEPSLSFEDLKDLPADEQFCRVVEYAKSVSWVPPDFTLGDAQRLIVLFRSHAQAGDQYVAKPYPGKVDLFLANEAPFQDPTLGWGKVAQGGVDIHLVQGNHLSIVSKPHVEILAKQLRNCLEQAD